MGKIMKGLVKFTVAAAAVGGICYAFKDKIKETEVYKNNNVDEKINKVKTTIKEKMPKVFDKEKDIVDENEIFVEDCAEDGERGYVSLDAEAAEETEVSDVADEEAAAEA